MLKKQFKIFLSTLKHLPNRQMMEYFKSEVIYVYRFVHISDTVIVPILKIKCHCIFPFAEQDIFLML